MRLTLFEISQVLGCGPDNVLVDGMATVGNASRLEQAPWARVLPSGAQTDSRLVGPGDIFFCLKGERVDGHDFAGIAAAAGACAVVAEHPPFAEAAPTLPIFLVPDTMRALARLAFCHRESGAARVVGITGSAGKTSVKEVLAHILSMRGETARNHMNLNNRIGLPLSMLNASAEASFWVLEAGISEPGDMDELGDILRPDFGLVLNAGAAHSLGLGDKGTAHYKARLLRYVQPLGKAFICADYPDLVREVGELSPKPSERGIEINWFSGAGHPQAMCTARYLGSFSATQGRFLVETEDRECLIYAPFRGAYGAENVAACFAVARRAGLSFEEIAQGFAGAELPAQRFCLIRKDNCLIIDDSYNSNPLSAGRMIEAAADLAQEGERPLFLVMGEMLELGDIAEQAHETLGRQMAAVHPHCVFWKGGMAEAVRRGLKLGEYKGPFYPVAGGQEFSGLLEEIHFRGGVILVKGSRGNKLERLVEVLDNSSAPAGGI